MPMRCHGQNICTGRGWFFFFDGFFDANFVVFLGSYYTRIRFGYN
jgi:hypothetical protein